MTFNEAREYVDRVVKPAIEERRRHSSFVDMTSQLLVALVDEVARLRSVVQPGINEARTYDPEKP